MQPEHPLHEFCNFIKCAKLKTRDYCEYWGHLNISNIQINAHATVRYALVLM